MLNQFPTLEMPSFTDLIWKYMSIDSFKQMIEKKSLWFYNYQKMAEEFDPYEGHVPFQWEKSFDEYKKEELNQYREAIESIFNERGITVNDYSKFTSNDVFRIFRPITYVSCMCTNNCELYHMWETYANKNGIAVNFRYNKLKELFSISDVNIYAGKVKYTDYKQSLKFYINTIWNLFFVKRNIFESDKEFRAIIMPNKETSCKKGYDLKIDFNYLLENIVLHYNNTVKDAEEIQTILDKNNIHTKIIFSEVKQRPSI